MRALGSGSLRKDGRWVIRVTLTAPDGAKRRQPVYADSQREVLAKARDLLAKNPKRVARTKRTIEDLLAACAAGPWLKHKPKTQEQYAWARPRIEKAFGGLAIEAVTRPMIYKWCEQLADDPKLSGRSVQIHRNVLRVALEYAVNMGWTAANPAMGWVLPVEVKSEGSAAVSEEDAIVAIEGETNKHYKLFLWTLWESGMRPHECNAMTSERLIELGGQWWVDVPGTKTEAAVRFVPITSALANELLDLPEPWFGFGSRTWTHIWHQAQIRLGWREARTQEKGRVRVPPDRKLPTLYGLRKGRITVWGDVEMKAELWAKLAGHEDPALTRKIYDRPDLRRLARRLGLPTE